MLVPQLRPTNLSHQRHGHRLERLDGGLLLFGGYGSATRGRGMQQTFWLGPGDATWQPRADMNMGRAFFGSAIVNGSVYAVGNGVERYVAAADQWEVVVPAGSLPRSHFATAALGSTLFVLGGFPEYGGFLAIDLDTGAVDEEAPPPGFNPGDHFHFMVVLAGQLHVIGGLDGQLFETRREHWVRVGGGWQAQPPPPPGLWAKFAAHIVHDEELFLFGDFGAFSYDASTRQWQERAPLPQMLAMPGAVASGSEIWVVGGLAVEDQRSKVLLRYDRGRNVWAGGGS